MVSACSNLSTSLRKSMSDFRLDDDCDAIFLIAIFIIVCIQGVCFLYQKFCFLHLVVLWFPFGSLQFSLHKTFWLCLFLSNQIFYKKNQ